jgi:UDP-glucose 4-epimerase
MRIFITGIAGFLGSHLADALIARSHEVEGNDNLICGDKTNVNRTITFSYTDCCSYDALRFFMGAFKPDVVVHCAATAAEGFSVFSPHFITRNIAEASVSTFSAAIASGAKRIVTMSSMSRYGKGKPPFAENDNTAPVDPYAIAKVYAEAQLKMLCEEHGVKWSILVPHNIIGTRQEITPYRNVVSIFLNRLKLGQPVYIYGDGEQKRSFSPVADCIQSIVKAVEGQADSEIVNIGPDDNEITINELLTICEEVTGKKAERVYLPPRPVTDSVKEAYCSSEKSRTLLGYKPEQDIRTCIKEMNEAFEPREFDYSFPLEIMSDKVPKTWREKL